ncbi:ACT domain-containing protein [Leptolyngbya sp. FACHB-321]|uniref:ACT domain-containing protein n=1 Tax=Leptolyngbya sp. FACHB-321 TaxID=2692807 RepID=UPI0018EF455B
MQLTLAILQEVFAICQLDRALPISAWSLQGFFAVARTQDKLSIMCTQAVIPPTADISIFAISAYNTDYVLVKQSVLKRAVQVLLQAGHQVVPASLTYTAS